MTTRAWHRLDPGFLARVLPRVSRSRFHFGVKETAGDGAALVRNGLASLFHYVEGRLLAVPTLSAVLAARDRGALRRMARALPADASGFDVLLTRPSSKKARELRAQLAVEAPGPTSAAFFHHAGDRKTAARLLRPRPDDSPTTLVEAAHVRAAFLDDRRGARAALSKASPRVGSTFEALAVAEAWRSILDDRAAAVRALEAGRPFARNRGGLARLAWGWGAVLGDVERARDLLREADALTPLGSQDPTCARDWRALMGDDDAARATLETMESRARTSEDCRAAALEWWTVFGDRPRALAAARKGATAARGARDLRLIAEALATLKDRTGARKTLDEAETACASGWELAEIAEARVAALRDRKGASASLEKAMNVEDNAFGVEAYVETGLKTLGAPATRILFEKRERRAATFDDHLVFAKIRGETLPDAKAHARHLTAAAGLAREPFQIRDLAKYLRESGKDLERADLLIEEAMARAKDVAEWTTLTQYKPGDPSAFFRAHWPRAAELAGPGSWAVLIDHALSFQDPALSRLVLEAFETRDADAVDLLRAAEEWHGLGETERSAAAIERAERAGAKPLDLADAWAKAGHPEKVLATLPRIEASLDGDILALGRCAQAWHGAGQADRARDCLERASAAAREPHEHQACATLWQNLFLDLRRADACVAKMGAAAGAMDVRLPGFVAGIDGNPAADIAESAFMPASVGF